MINFNEIYIHERSYNKLTLNFKDKQLQDNYLMTRKLDVQKKIILCKLISLQNILLIILNFTLYIQLEDIINQNYYFRIWIFFSIYTFCLAFQIIILRFKEKIYQILQYLTFAITIILNSIILVYIMDMTNASHQSLMVIFQFFLSILFQSEYIDSFLSFNIQCGLFFVFLLIM